MSYCCKFSGGECGGGCSFLQSVQIFRKINADHSTGRISLRLTRPMSGNGRAMKKVYLFILTFDHIYYTGILPSYTENDNV
jgi:hypothetical protein